MKIPIKFAMKNLFLLLPFLLPGCWSSKELSESAILNGAAIEKVGSDYKITYQIMDPKKIKNQEPEADVLITTLSPTIHEGLIQHIKGTKRRVFLSHTRAIIISSELARKEGVFPVLELGNRDQQLRLNSFIYIADDPAKILGLPSPLDPMSAIGLFKGTESVKNDVSQMSAISLRELLMENLSPVGSGYVTYLREHREKKPAITHVDISGPAVLKKGKLVKIIKSPTITRGILWFNNKVKRGSLSLDIPGESTAMAAIELHQASSQIKPHLQDGKLSFDVEVKCKGDINEWQSNKPLTNAKIKLLEHEMEKEVSREMSAALNQMRKEPVTDILNLGLEVYRQHPKYWDQIHNDWDDIFKHVDIHIEVEAKIKSAGVVKDRAPDRPKSNLLPWADSLQDERGQSQ